MYQLACRDLGMSDDNVVIGNTIEEVKQKAMDHVKTIHPDLHRTLSSPEKMADMVKQMESKIKSR